MPEVRAKLDEVIADDVAIVVGKELGARGLYQDYLKFKGYRNVVVGHAAKLRYNAGNWKDLRYGKDLKERERRMIEDCDHAIVIWMDNSARVIAENLELLKRLGKPTRARARARDREEQASMTLNEPTTNISYERILQKTKRARTV